MERGGTQGEGGLEEGVSMFEEQGNRQPREGGGRGGWAGVRREEGGTGLGPGMGKEGWVGVGGGGRDGEHKRG